MRSWAAHFPDRRREHRIKSVPGHSKQLAEGLLQFLREVKGAENMPKAEHKALCETRKKELRTACGGEQVMLSGAGMHLVGEHGGHDTAADWLCGNKAQPSTKAVHHSAPPQPLQSR